MTAHEYLSQARYVDSMINSHIEEVERLRCLADCLPTMDFSKDRIKGGVQVQSKMVEVVNKYVDLQTQINADIDTYVDLREEIRESISAVSSIRLKQLLRHKYIHFRSLEETAERMNLSLSHVKRLHILALAEVIVPEKYKDIKS